MPTLFRFIVTIGAFVGMIYGGMFALATYVQPTQGEITVRIPANKLNK